MTYVRALQAVGWIIIAGATVTMICVLGSSTACRSVVPVVQVNTTMQCTVTETNAAGGVRMDCKVDGHKVDAPVTGPSGTGDDTVELPESSWIFPGPDQARLN